MTKQDLLELEFKVLRGTTWFDLTKKGRKTVRYFLEDVRDHKANSFYIFNHISIHPDDAMIIKNKAVLKKVLVILGYI